ncbi:AT-hook motif nuclear-localized protein 10 [Cardamine amara subsp. amara]|uniref:AT-hook motif nuclear-localized protein n=1 Tax=Cardamine amara subsp. amara TaxID=228776 RepID=A0ABD1ACG1_CARAN
MAGFRVTIPLSRDLHQQQQQRRALPQQSQNMQLPITGADDEASPPPQHQPNSAGSDHAVPMSMLVKEKRGRGRPRKHTLVDNETSHALVPGLPSSFTVSQPSGSGGQTSPALAPGAPPFTVSRQPRGSAGQPLLALAPRAPPFTVSKPSGSAGQTSLALAPGAPLFTVSQPSGSGGETSLALVTGGPSFTVSHPSGSGGETALALVTGGPSFTVSPPSGTRGRVKKMRGRRGPPSSSANNVKLQALGSSGVGVGFTPHIFTILPGENVAAKIMELNMNGPCSVCVFSANGCISSVTVRNPTTSDGTVSYEGIFEILSLSGSYVPVEIDGYLFMTGGLSVSLSRLDNVVFGGRVVGSLVAAKNVQVVVGTFIQERHKDSDQHMGKIEFYTPTLPSEDPTQRLMVPRSHQFQSISNESSGGEEYESPWGYP